MSILENIKFWNILGFKSFLGIFAVTKNVGWSTFSKFSGKREKRAWKLRVKTPPFLLLYMIE